jgi:membrane protease YdiL (CAAX protease family)
VERLRTSVLLILIVVGILLRLDALIILYTKRRSVPLLEGIALSLISPVMAMISFNFGSIGRWSLASEKDNAAKLVIGALGLLFGSQLAASWIYLQIVFALDMTLGGGRFFGPAAEQGSFGPEMVLLMVVLYAAILVPILVIHMGRDRVKRLFEGGRLLTTLSLGAGAMLLVQVATSVAFFLVRGNGGPVPTSMFQAPNGIGEMAILIVAVALIAPLIEEMIFRGAIYLAVSERLGRTYAVLISSFLFALSHMDPISFLPLFGLGLILGWCRSRSGSILPSYILHALNNFAAILFL